MTDDVLISVIVSTYNNPKALKLVLAGLFCQSDKNFEIIVADDGSASPTRELIENEAALHPDHTIRHVWQPDQGFRLARIRNLGTMAASGEYLIFLDGDCVPAPDFVAGHRKLATERCVVLGQRILTTKPYAESLMAGSPMPDWHYSTFRILQKEGKINRAWPAIRFMAPSVRRQVPFSHNNIRGCNFSLYKADYVAVNGSDESFVGWGSEDKDLALRLAKNGNRFVPGHFGPIVLHLWHPESRRSNEEKNRVMVENRSRTGVVRAVKGLDVLSEEKDGEKGTPDAGLHAACRIDAGISNLGNCMSQPLITVLVPCFNVERYVVQCLESIKCQTLREIEVICLNDGSTDSTLEKIRATVGDDPRFRIINKPNSGYGATMNLGLRLAKGDFIGIVESDDYIELTMFEKLYRQVAEHDLDISRCCYNRDVDGKIKPTRCKFLPKNVTFDSKAQPDTLLNPPAIWAAIYRREMIERFGIRFLETPGAAFQDISFAFKTALAASKIRCSEECLLNYRIHNANSVKKGGKTFEVIKELDECLRFAREHLFGDIVKEVMLPIEYATCKWNYKRLSADDAHAFYEAWVKRWRSSQGYGISAFDGNVKHFMQYKVITTLPNLFEKYLRGKSQK